MKKNQIGLILFAVIAATSFVLFRAHEGAAVRALPFPPKAPTDLAVGILSTNPPSVALVWKDNAITEKGFKVERSTISATSNFLLVAETNQNTSAFVDTSVSSGITYWYRVAAYDAFAQSEYSNVVSVATFPPPGMLKVSTLPTPVAQTIVAGAQNFNFANFSFDTTASSENIKVHSVQVEYNFGQANSNDDLTSCQLWDGGVALNTGTNIVNGSNSDITGDDKIFTFDQPWIVPKGIVKTLALKCNTTATSTQITSAYNWTLEIPGDTDDVVAVGVMSNSPITAVYNDTTGQTITLTKSGSLSVLLASENPPIRMVSADTQGNVLSAYLLVALNEDIKLTQVGLMLAGTGSNTPQDLSKVTLWNGAVQLGEVIFTGDTATATILNIPQAIISKDEHIILTIKGDIGKIGPSDPARPGHVVRVEIDPAAGTPAGAATQGIGMSSGSAIYPTGPNPSPTPGVYIFKSVPTLAKNALPSNQLTNGTKALYRFSVSAPSLGNVGLYKFTFKVATSTGGIPFFKIDNMQVRGYVDSGFTTPAYPNGGLLNNNTKIAPDGLSLYGFYFDPVSQSGIKEAIQVPAGTTRYFELTGAVSGVATSSVAVVSLQGDYEYTMGTNNKGDEADNFTGPKGGNYAFATTAANVDFGTHDNFIWSDNATTTSGVSTYDWVNAFVVPGLPKSSMLNETLVP